MERRSAVVTWRAALAREPSDADARADVARVVVDVALPSGERGLVTVSQREGAIVAVDDMGRRDSALVEAAVGWLGGLVVGEPGSETVAIRSDHPAARTSLAPTPPSGRGQDAARDLALALVRSGLAGARRGAIDETLRRARSTNDSRTARWTARVERAIATEDLALIAQLTRGVLDTAPPAQSSRVELHLVEIAREHLDAARPRALERRHLVDLTTGALYAEDLDAGVVGGSIGPCPRALEVGLAEVSDDGGQSSLCILQYTTTSTLSSATRARLLELTTRDLATAFSHVDTLLRASPAFAEPVVMLEIARWEAGLHAFDASGAEVPWSRDEDPAACARLAEIVAERAPRFVVLRAVPRRGAHAFVAISCAIEDAGELEILRLRG